MSKIFVRERHHVGQGDQQPRYAILATEGTDLRFYQVHVRRTEVEKVAEEVGAEIVYLARGEFAEEIEPASGKRRGRRHRVPGQA